MLEDSAMKQIIKKIEEEDLEKLFTGENHPNIYDAVDAISNLHESKEVEKALKHYFEQVVQIKHPSSKVRYEAQRMLEICEGFFEQFKKNEEGAAQPPTNSNRGLNDVIADFYLESLTHFASFVDEEILFDHIRYLDS
ncbi:hypothetical protein GINT2_000326 [Glugoides intestinalis]